MSAEDPAYPSLRWSWWPMLLLFLAANLYSIDKAIVGVLAEPIKADFGITDVQMGLLLGLAYSVLSGLLGLVLGSLVDRHVRRTVLAGSIILWSLSTAAGGLAPNFHWFFVFRALVGLGEAAVAPAAISLIADMFPPRHRGRALGTYLIGATIGSALSSIIPARIVGANLHLYVPGFGAVAPWRSAFLLCGLVGPIIGLLFLTVREPARRGLRSAAADPATLTQKLAYLWRQRSVTVPLYAGFCLFYVAFVGISAWTAAFLTRTYHQPLTAFAGEMGLMMLLAGGSGYIAGGILTDSVAGRQRGGKLIVMAVLPLVALPTAFAAFAPGIGMALVALAAISFATPMINVGMSASIQDVVPNDMRGFSYALVSVVSALPAGAGGPLAIAMVTQYVIGDEAGIGQSFLVIGLPSLLGASLCFAQAWRGLRRASEDSELAGVIRAGGA